MVELERARAERIEADIPDNLDDDHKRLIRATAKYRQVHGQYPPTYAFQAGMDDSEWADVLEESAESGTPINHKTIERFTGKRIPGEGSFRDEDHIDEFLEEARKANE